MCHKQNVLATKNPCNMKTNATIVCIVLFCTKSYSQMVFSENLNTYIDSTKTIQGMISPFFEFKTENKDVSTFKNLANINLLIKKKRVVNLINKFELSKYGEQVTLSSGYVHTEYRHLIGKVTEVYPYFESQWAESRGMPFKISTGLQSRFRLFHNQNHLLFTNVALFLNMKNGVSFQRTLLKLQKKAVASSYIILLAISMF